MAYTAYIDSQRDFIFGRNMYICSWYMHIKYLGILTYSFYMVAILVFFFDLLSCYPMYIVIETSYCIYLPISSLLIYRMCHYDLFAKAYKYFLKGVCTYFLL